MKITDIINSVNTNRGSAFFYTPLIYKNGKSILFNKPVKTIEAKNKTEFYEMLNIISNLLDSGLTGYGLINYEAGYLLENKLNCLFNENDSSIMTFYFFENNQVKIFENNDIEYNEIETVIGNNNYLIDNFKLSDDKKTYINNINRIRDFIKEGDTYQVNYTVKGEFDFKGNPQSLFLSLIFNQSAEYSALINNGTEFIISISPELFFDVSDYTVTVKPMKGTVKRGINVIEDKLKTDLLFNSKKDRAENVMILDLLRNDLGKISEFNSVNVKSYYNIEKYESLFQMTSTVNAQLKTNSFPDIIKSLFPCGSITGAPKIRTMEIISQLENQERGIYTGAIGIVNKNNYKFNVPIRTIKLLENGKGEIGLGSGIVWDSNPEEEYQETILKSKFFTQPSVYFKLFESVLVENGIPFLLEEHLQRLKEASDYFLFNFDYSQIYSSIFDFIDRSGKDKNYKLKIILDKWGQIEIQKSFVETNNTLIKIIVSQERINSKNKFQYFKTTNRNIYDDEFKKYGDKGFYEVIYLNEKDEIAEGSFTNIFAVYKNKWITPSINCGILNGVYRQKLLDENKDYSEDRINMNLLLNADEIILVNSVRKSVRVNQLWCEGKIIKEFN